MKKRKMAFGSWDAMWQAAAFLFSCIFIFSLLVGFFTYLFSCFYLRLPIFVDWGLMSLLQQSIIGTIIISTLLNSLLMTLMLTVLYERIIYFPVKDLLGEVEKASGIRGLSKQADLYLRGGKKQIFDLYSPRESWVDLVHDYIEDATQDRYFDEMTGCFNRKYFAQAITDILKTQMLCSLSNSNLPQTINSYSYGIYLIDIDHFKHINDEFGHAYGDQVLRQVGKTLRSAIGSEGVVVRNGGEEFLVIACLSFPMHFSQLAEKLRREFSDSVYVEDPKTQKKRSVTCSVGYVPFPMFPKEATSLSVEQHVNLADQAMYLSKNEGRNTWRGIIPGSPPQTQNKIDQASVSFEYGIQNGFYVVERPPIHGDSM